MYKNQTFILEFCDEDCDLFELICWGWKASTFTYVTRPFMPIFTLGQIPERAFCSLFSFQGRHRVLFETSHRWKVVSYPGTVDKPRPQVFRHFS